MTMRLRVTFAKTALMRYTSHLDLHRAWERTIRRSGLPLAYKAGFNPRPRINLASALPLGFTSAGEIIDIWLEEELPIDRVQTALAQASPPGILVQGIDKIGLPEPAAQTQLEQAEYLVTLLDTLPDLGNRCAEIMTSETLPRERRGKTYDLRPLIEALEPVPSGEDGEPRVRMTLSAKEGATGRPEEVAACIGVPPDRISAHRTRLIFRSIEPVNES